MTVLPRLTGIEGTPPPRQIRTAGAIHAGYSTITDYPLGFVKVLPFQAHLATRRRRRRGAGGDPLPHRPVEARAPALGPARRPGLFELASLAMTDPTGRGDFHGDVDAVRRANMEDPHRKIHEGPPAVRRNGQPVAA